MAVLGPHMLLLIFTNITIDPAFLNCTSHDSFCILNLWTSTFGIYISFRTFLYFVGHVSRLSHFFVYVLSLSVFLQYGTSKNLCTTAMLPFELFWKKA